MNNSRKNVLSKKASMVFLIVWLIGYGFMGYQIIFVEQSMIGTMFYLGILGAIVLYSIVFKITNDIRNKKSDE